MKILLPILFTLCSFAGYAQSVLPMRGDTIKIYKQGGSAELVLRNSTRDTTGVLVNMGGGRTAFVRSRKINDSTIVIGTDTLENIGSGSSTLYRNNTLEGDGTIGNPLGVNAAGITPYIYNVAEYGIYPDGSDHTALFNALLVIVNNAGGGWIQFNNGQYLFAGQIKFPFSVSNPSLPEMKGMRIMGTASGANGRVYVSNNGATRLNLTYVGSPAKIDTRGSGRLEISNIAFMNSNAATDSTAFIQTTNTSLYIHDCSFVGAGGGYTGSITDAIILGGTTVATDTSVNGGFQGYGTTIRENFFDRIRRGVYGRSYANAVNIDKNTWWNACGGTVNNAAIEFRGDTTNSCVGSAITNNLFELVGYKYAIMLRRSLGFSITGNTYYDRDGYNLYPVYLGFGSSYHHITETFIEGMTTSVYDSTAIATGLPTESYIQSSLQGGTNRIPNNIDISGEIYKRGGYSARVFDGAGNGNSTYWATIGNVLNGSMVNYLAYKPATDPEEVLMSLDRPATTGLNMILGYSATSYVKIKSNASNLYLNQAAGKELYLGPEGAENLYIDASSVTTARNKPILYSNVSHGLLTGHNLVDRDLVDSLLATVSGGATLWTAGAGSDIYHNPGGVTITGTSAPRGGNLDVRGIIYGGIAGSTPGVFDADDGMVINAEADGGSGDRSIKFGYGRQVTTGGTTMVTMDNTGTTIHPLAGTGTRMVTTTSAGLLGFTALPPADLWTAGTGSNIYLNSSGNVGLGSGLTTPVAKLSLGTFAGASAINVHENGANQYGLGVNASEFQLYSPSGTHLSINIADGGLSATGVNEKFRVTTTGFNTIGTGQVGATSGQRGQFDVRGSIYGGTPASDHFILNSDDGVRINAEADAGSANRFIELGYGTSASSGGTVMANFGQNGSTLYKQASYSAAFNMSALNLVYKQYADSIYAPLISPALTGTPTTSAPSVGTASTQIATTNFVDKIKPGKQSIITNSTAINTTETQILSYVIASNDMIAGTTYQVTAFGTCTSTGTNASNFRVRIGTAGTTADQEYAIITTTAASSGTNVPFEIKFLITVRTTGATGTAAGNGILHNGNLTGVSSQTPNIGAPTISGTTLNTTVQNTIGLYYVSAASSTTTTFQIATIEQVRQ